MAKPTIGFAAWASDTNFSSGPDATTVTKVDPGLSFRAQGYVPGLRFVSQYVNFWKNQAYQWFQYLDNLHGETQFLNKAYTWTGQHKLTSAAGATDPQWATPRQHTLLVPSNAYRNLVPFFGTGWQFIASNGATHGIACNSPSTLMWVDLGSVIPSGAVLDEVRIKYFQGTSDTGSNRFKFRLIKYTNLEDVTATVETVVDVSGDDASHFLYATVGAGSWGTVILDPTTTESPVRGGATGPSSPPALSSYMLEVTSSAGVSGGTVDRIKSVFIGYTEPTINRTF